MSWTLRGEFPEELREIFIGLQVISFMINLCLLFLLVGVFVDVYLFGFFGGAFDGSNDGIAENFSARIIGRM